MHVNTLNGKYPLAYFISVIAMSLIMSAAYGDQGVHVRLLFELFIGSSIFLAFFMATDPATTPFNRHRTNHLRRRLRHTNSADTDLHELLRRLTTGTTHHELNGATP